MENNNRVNETFQRENKNTRTGTGVQNSPRSPQSARPVRYAQSSFSWMLEAGVDETLFAVGIVLVVYPAEGLVRTMITRNPWRYPLAKAMGVE